MSEDEEYEKLTHCIKDGNLPKHCDHLVARLACGSVYRGEKCKWHFGHDGAHVSQSGLIWHLNEDQLRRG